MDHKTKAALLGSITKWQTIVDHPKIAHPRCPLCDMFIVKTGVCDGCPVMQSSGKAGCIGTPFTEYWQAKFTGRTRLAAKAARAELAFLQSLLPPESAA